MKTFEKIYNAETGEETIIERDLTAGELAEIKKWEEHIAENARIEKEIADAKAPILAKLGLTEEEARLLLG